MNPTSYWLLILCFMVTLVFSGCDGNNKEGGGSNLNSTATPTAPGNCETHHRNLYQHWIDADGDCQDTRAEVLIAESRVPVAFQTAPQSSVSSGEWFGAYAGQVFTDPSELDVDHLVPLKEAHESGTFSWDASRKRDFANDLSDPNHLIAVSASQNRSKGAKDLNEWMPADSSFHCRTQPHGWE